MMRITTCPQCGKYMTLGDDYYTSRHTGDLEFCSRECIRAWASESCFDEILDEWEDESVEEYEYEAEDPYDRYGVSERDFQ